MRIEKIETNKKQYLELLLLADESEAMIDKYLERGDMYVLFDDEIICECVVTNEGGGTYELKNIATYEKYQRQGYGKKLVKYVLEQYKDVATKMLVGTGDVDKSLNFYKGCGFVESHRLVNFFIDNYDHVMIEDGVQLVDMVYLMKTY